jgi:hypothetical protein
MASYFGDSMVTTCMRAGFQHSDSARAANHRRHGLIDLIALDPRRDREKSTGPWRFAALSIEVNSA